jgi:hypothetical protein
MVRIPIIGSGIIGSGGAFLKRRLAAFYGAGIVDQFITRFTGKDSSFAKALIQKLSGCEPWTDHFYPPALEDIKNGIANKDFAGARMMADLGAETLEPGTKASAYCIELLKKYIKFLAFGEMMETEDFTISYESIWGDSSDTEY